MDKIRYFACTRIVCLTKDGAVSYAHEASPISTTKSYGTEDLALRAAQKWIADAYVGPAKSDTLRIEAMVMDSHQLADREAIRWLRSRGWTVHP